MPRLNWRVARLLDAKSETSTARTLSLQVDGWPGHLAGQHVDVRLTAEDGYTAQRSYSIASPTGSDTIELTVQLVPDGEVSSYLVDAFAIGDPVELRGPIGGWFVWRPELKEPVLLIAGGSGIVPLMAMVRTRAIAGSESPCRLIYSVRTPREVYYADELRVRASEDDGLDVALLYTRETPVGATRPAGRITGADLTSIDPATRCFVCGPTGFVEHVADQLVAQGHDSNLIRTERFGPTGG